MLFVATVPLLSGCARLPPRATPTAAAGEERDVDLEDEVARARAFLLVRGSTDPEEEVVFHWTGEIFALAPAEPLAEAGPSRRASPILRIEGLNVARFEATASGARMVSREVTFYLDEEGEIVDCWENPFTDERVPVLHVWNDPVSFDLGAPPAEVLGDEVAFSVGVSVQYPSPLPVEAFPASSAGNTYQSTELFDFFAALGDLAEPGRTSVPATFVWTRVGQWLPWMRMGQRPGWLVFHARGQRVAGGFEGLPERLRRAVLDRDARFAHAPTGDGSPNATSWTRFRDLQDAGALPEGCAEDPAGR